MIKTKLNGVKVSLGTAGWYDLHHRTWWFLSCYPEYLFIFL